MRKSSLKFHVGLALLISMVAAAFAIAPAGASAACDFGGLTAAETDLCTPAAKASGGMSAITRVAPDSNGANNSSTAMSKPKVVNRSPLPWPEKSFACS